MILFAIFIGGNHPKANIELHDIRFVVGESLQDTFGVLRSSWWGDPQSLHIDAYAELGTVSGHRITVRREFEEASSLKLFFINLGFYETGKFGESHDYQFIVAQDAKAAWRSAKSKLKGCHSLHQDNLMIVDDIIDISECLTTDGYCLEISPTSGSADALTVSKYIDISQDTLL